MNVSIKFVLELPYIKEKGKKIDDLYEKSGYVGLSPFRENIDLYDLSSLSDANLEAAIKLHISDIEFHDCCSLFGGVALSIDDVDSIYPQCCGTLSDFKFWLKILERKNDYWLSLDAHPCPKVTRNDDLVILECEDDCDEAFSPVCEKIIRIEYDILENALNLAKNEFEFQCKRVDRICDRMGYENASNILMREE